MRFQFLVQGIYGIQSLWTEAVWVGLEVWVPDHELFLDKLLPQRRAVSHFPARKLGFPEELESRILGHRNMHREAVHVVFFNCVPQFVDRGEIVFLEDGPIRKRNNQ